MKRREFFGLLLFMVAVLAIESLVVWRRNLKPIYVRRDDGQRATWHRIRLYQAQRGDCIRWGHGIDFICVSDPWFCVPKGDWGVTVVQAGGQPEDYPASNRPLLVWSAPGAI